MLTFEICNTLILVACGLGLLWAIINAYLLTKIKFDVTSEYQSFQDDQND